MDGAAARPGCPAAAEPHRAVGRATPTCGSWEPAKLLSGSLETPNQTQGNSPRARTSLRRCKPTGGVIYGGLEGQLAGCVPVSRADSRTRGSQHGQPAHLRRWSMLVAAGQPSSVSPLHTVRAGRADLCLHSQGSPADVLRLWHASGDRRPLPARSCGSSRVGRVWAACKAPPYRRCSRREAAAIPQPPQSTAGPCQSRPSHPAHQPTSSPGVGGLPEADQHLNVGVLVASVLHQLTDVCAAQAEASVSAEAKHPSACVRALEPRTS